MTLRLIIANKNYSSWSLRPWFAIRHTELAFEEQLVSLYTPEGKQQIRELHGSAKVPLLVMDSFTVADSMAICETLAELDPRLWPSDPQARAWARSVAAEMHSGFPHLRNQMPMNCRALNRKVTCTPETLADIARIETVWSECRTRFLAEGPWLFGSFSIADAMFAPVVARFNTYGVALNPICSAYLQMVLQDGPMREWFESARQETFVVESYEIGV